MNDVLLEIDQLKTNFYSENGVVKAVDGVSLNLKEGETLGIVGESGSGKTVTALSILNLIENPGKIDHGKILFKGNNLLSLSEPELQKIRGHNISMVFQDSLSSLNPTLTIGEQVGRVLQYHTKLSKKERHYRSVELLDLVGIPESKSRYKNYPHEFSGGMRQRVLIAMAISCNPELLILDEPTTALDVTIEAQIFKLIESLKKEFKMGIILISHDLGVVADTCDKVMIMYSGKILESSEVRPIFHNPKHPYTKALLKSIPKLDQNKNEALYSIPGEVPDLLDLPKGCNFSTRCEYSDKSCRETDPLLETIDDGRQIACLKVKDLNG